MSSPDFDDVCRVLLLPVQVLTEYDDSEVDTVLQITERMHAHLTAAIVSNDVHFLQKMLANTVNGTTYAGIRARCTGMLLDQHTASLSCIRVVYLTCYQELGTSALPAIL